MYLIKSVLFYCLYFILSFPERTGGSFSLLAPSAPLRSLSEVRRHQSRSQEDNEQLVAPSSIH